MKNKIIWACSDCGCRNYTTDNREKSSERLTIKKYCKTCNAHTVHRQTK
ncbi:MAG TPA: 50S ribosomal protein L33 [Bacillus bacterium]|nr:50S ribosomal protein L33 [Siminovitchia fordii]HBZ11275.1 50S ribosomal protein L33 [Bacillus sp. (in: firmicutes)]